MKCHIKNKRDKKNLFVLYKVRICDFLDRHEDEIPLWLLYFPYLLSPIIFVILLIYFL